jgi:hypothetical protein
MMSEALRKAAEQALEALKTSIAFANEMGIGHWQHTAMTCHEAVATLRAALAEPEQSEPVAWMMVNPTHLPQSRSLHWEPQQWHVTWEAVPLYTHPPSREPLTQEKDFAWVCNECGSHEYTSSVSEADLAQFCSCGACGCDEFHKEPK